eukprot:COSAG05_NODE_9498_length_620_cov_1.180422_1_plen_29_part_10
MTGRERERERDLSIVLQYMRNLHESRRWS